MDDNNKATNKEINTIIKYIEDLKKSRMLVEDIQDIIEIKLMQFKKFELAKIYIIYRYTRALIRKSNLTDENILQIIKNRKNIITNEHEQNLQVVIQKNKIAELVSTDITRRMLLPEKIVSAHDRGKIYFNKMDNYIHSMIEDSLLDYDLLLRNLNNRNFISICLDLATLIITEASNQNGKVYVDINCLTKYCDYTHNYLKKHSQNCEKEYIEILKQGIRIIAKLLNEIVTIHGKTSKVVMIINPYNKSSAILTEIILKEKISWELIYILNKDNVRENSRYYYLTNEVMNFKPYITTSEKYYNYRIRFLQGRVSLNMAQIVIESIRKNIDIYILLDERINLCLEALLTKNHSLVNVLSDSSPIIWQQGGLATINKGERIDKILKSNISKLQIDYYGIDAFYKFYDYEQANINILDAINFLKNKIKEWQKNHNIRVELVGASVSKINTYFKELDNNQYGYLNDLKYDNNLDIKDKNQKLLFAKKINLILEVDLNCFKKTELTNNIYDNNLFIKIK